VNKLVTLLLAALLTVSCNKPAEAPWTAVIDKSENPMTDAKIFDLPYLMRDLDNGLRVIVVPTDYPDIVTLQIPVQTGSRNEIEPGKTGFAHFFEHMMFRGTVNYPSDVYSRILKEMGADNGASTDDDYTLYQTTFTRDDLEKVIELEADRFKHLSYSEEVFRTEALAVKGEYLKNHANPIETWYERVSDLMYSRHTYKHTVMGFVEDIDAMPEQLEYSKVFFDRWYRPEKTAVILVGDVDPEAAFELVDRYWSDWERGDYDIDVPVEPPLDGPKYEHYQWESSTQPWVVMAFRGPAFRPTEKDMPALNLLSSMYLSEGSALYQKIVIEEQWADQLLRHFPNQKDPAMVIIYARLISADHAVAVRDAINETLVDARTRLVSRDKVGEAKSRLRYGFTAQLDDSGTIGSILARFVQFFRTPETINELYRTYDSLTAEDVRHYANRYFTDTSRVMMTLSSDESMPGIDDMPSIDELVAAAGAAESIAKPAAETKVTDLPASGVSAEAAVPVRFVARPSESAPLINVAFIVHAGAGFDPEGKKGLATLTAAMLTDAGSEARTIEEINAAMYPIAAGFKAQVDKEMTRLSGQVHKDNLDAWYSLVRGQLLFPAWSAEDFARIKNQLSNTIRTNLVANNDEELAKEFLYTAIYGSEHPYGSLNLGAISDIEAITLEDVKAFYRQYYTIANITVGLAGGYPASFSATISDDLQKLQPGQRAALDIPAPPLADAAHAVVIEKETPGVAVSFGLPIKLRRGDPDWVALWLACSYLGEHRTMNGQLFQRIRKLRGMNYGTYAYIEYFPRGMFLNKPDTNLGRQQQIFQVWIRPVRSNNDAQFAARVAVHELDRLISEGMSESDFAATRRYLSKYVSLLTDGQSRQLGYALDGQYYETGDFSEYVRESLSRLTLDDVNRVIRENLSTDSLQFVFVTRDAGDLRDRLAGEQVSPMTYDATLPQEVLDEDTRIADLPLNIAADKIRIVKADDAFD
jgi:zinc protease